MRVLTNAAMIIGASEEAIGGKGRHFELIALLALSGGLTKEDARACDLRFRIEHRQRHQHRLPGPQDARYRLDGQPFLPEARSRGILTLSPSSDH